SCAFSCSADHPDLPSFPTRRSSDLSSFQTQPALAWPRVATRRARLRPGASSDDPSNWHRITVAQRPSGTTRRGPVGWPMGADSRSEEHTSELQSRENLVCRLLLEKK